MLIVVLRNIDMGKYHWHLWIGFVLPKIFRTWYVEYFTGIIGLSWMVYFRIYYIHNVTSWNKVEQKAVKGYYSADFVILKENNTQK